MLNRNHREFSERMPLSTLVGACFAMMLALAGWQSLARNSTARFAPHFSVGSFLGGLPKANGVGGGTITCAANAVNNPGVDAAPILNACFAQNPEVVELLPGRYYLSSQVVIQYVSNMTVRTQGVNGGPACLTPGAPACAILTAADTKGDGHLVWGHDLNAMTFDHVAVDGSIAQRRAHYSDFQGNAINAYFERCTNCTFRGFASVRSAKGSGMFFNGDYATFDTCLFRDNGWGHPNTTQLYQWADGLTVGQSRNLHIFNSTFADNSDIDLIIGGAPGGLIENNTVTHEFNFAFAGIMLDNFNNQSSGDFSGAIVRNNNVNCGESMCGIGINLGPHFWYPSSSVNGGQILSNVVLAARQGILSSGVTNMEVAGNGTAVKGLFYTPNLACSTYFISYTPGDGVWMHDNTQNPTTNSMSNCGPLNLAYMYTDFNGTDLTVSRLYREVLGRDPDMDGGPNWSNAYHAGMTEAQIRSSFALSQEAANKIDSLYRKVFGRPADSTGISNWQGWLASGGTIANLYVILQQYPEGLAHRTLTD